MYLLDLPVALGTCRRNVVSMDARGRVGVRQDLVRRVTGRADRRYREPLAIQTFAVNRLRVVLEDAVLGDIVRLRDWGALVVTLPAQNRDVQDRSRRVRISV